MTLGEQATRRVELARKMGCEPRRWIATKEAAHTAGVVDACLVGLPVEIGTPRSEWGLDLVSAPQAAVR